LLAHSGAFEQGLGDCALYNGTTYATLGVVTVAINYRLGALGFLASESMEGNYGILDQRLALQWTLDNIKGFGGNPEAITIAGQSAGAMSVGAHLTAKGSFGMFHQVNMALTESLTISLSHV
jgi:para-nitrobenzyl esterase